MTPEQKRACVIDFIDRSFRDMADKDYIAVRILYRANLGPQFLWAAEQAMEKYLKGVLLYNDVSTIKLVHNLEKALKALGQITDIPFDIPDDVRQFIRRLNEEGTNRYFEYPAAALGEELLQLDRAVWCIRRYCYWMRGTAGPATAPVERLPLELARVHALQEKDVHKFRITGGYLEKILGTPKARLRQHLVWKNFYYGSYTKRHIKRFTLQAWSAIPIHFRRPEIFDDLARLVRFSKPVEDYFRTRKGA
jgi:HEPN domain-containing protein